MMDAEWILATLNDALAELQEAVAAIDGAPEAVEELLPELLPAVYAKLNYAWNSRELGPEALDRLDHDELIAWPAAFPFGRESD
jgi:hypothetical protein